jgi:hypothetical protein
MHRALSGHSFRGCEKSPLRRHSERSEESLLCFYREDLGAGTAETSVRFFLPSLTMSTEPNDRSKPPRATAAHGAHDASLYAFLARRSGGGEFAGGFQDLAGQIIHDVRFIARDGKVRDTQQLFFAIAQRLADGILNLWIG